MYEERERERESKHDQPPMNEIFLLATVKGKSVSALCLEGLSHLLTVAVSQCRRDLSTILTRIASSSLLEEEVGSEDIDEQIHLFIRQFQVGRSAYSNALLINFCLCAIQRLVVGVLDGSVTAFSQKEAGLICTTIATLVGELSNNSTQV